MQEFNARFYKYDDEKWLIFDQDDNLIGVMNNNWEVAWNLVFVVGVNETLKEIEEKQNNP